MFLKLIIANVISNIIIFILYQGFVNSYWGRNAKEEVSRWFDQLSKHQRKLKKQQIEVTKLRVDYTEDLGEE